MQILIRADASSDMGTGHVMRCLSLANSLKVKGANITFVCRNLPGNAIPLIKEQAHTVVILPYDAQFWQQQTHLPTHQYWLGALMEEEIKQCLAIPIHSGNFNLAIVDHYALDARWENAMRAKAEKIMVIDDLADRQHDCDILLDQNLHANGITRYAGLLPKSTQLKLGPQYALLRPEFITARSKVAPCKKVQRLLVFMGGADHANATMKALRAIEQSQFNGKVDIVLGASNPNARDIENVCMSNPHWQTHVNIRNMAELMLQADLAIGATGASTWERCCCGLPTIAWSVAENQISLGEQAAGEKVMHYLGRDNEVNSHCIAEAINNIINDIDSLNLMQERALGIVDGQGCMRIEDLLMRECQYAFA